MQRRTINCLSAVALAAAGSLVAGVLGAAPAFAAVDGSGVVINEVYARGGSANQPFQNKFVELYNPTNADVSLSGWSIQYRSATSTGASSGVGALTGTIESGGYYLIGLNSNGGTGAALPTPDASFSVAPSGTTGSLFLAKTASAINPGNGSVVNNPQVADYVGYGGSLNFETAAAAYPGSNSDPGSIVRTNFKDTDDNSKDFSFTATPTPQNSGSPGGPVLPVAKTIAQIQGTDVAASPLVGQAVVTEGVVTADHRVGGYDGIFIQTPGPDTTPKASDGVFVYLHGENPGVEIGDKVRVTGTVEEFNGQTQLRPATAADVELVQADAGLPAPTKLPATAVGNAAREVFEGMLVVPDGTYKVISSHNLNRFGELWLNAGTAMPVKSTETQRPGTKAASDIAAANRASRILLDDGYSIAVRNSNGTDNPAHPGDQPYFTKGTVVRNGDVASFPASGYVLGWGFNEWRLQPRTPINDASPASVKPTFASVDAAGKVIGNPRPTTAPAVGGDITVASFNVLNYFTTLTSENSEARGADTAEEFAVQKAKIVKAINGLDADVVALQEIENSAALGETPDEALANLVAGLNSAAGAGTWKYVTTPEALHDAAITDVITNAIIYKPATVKPSGEAQTIIDETVWDIAREPIAQTFKYGKQFVTVIANHFKSKSGTDPSPEPGQDAFNDERVKQAESLLAFANSLSEDRKNAIYLVGDFNSYAKEDPIKVFTDAGWTDLVFSRARGQYTYSFDGELGSLDHVIASPAAASRVQKTAVWSINSPEWAGREYWGPAAETVAEATPFRSSDHDPILVGVGSEAVPGKVDIDLVTVNDFHGRIEQSAPSGGIAALSSAVKQIRAGNPNTVFAAAGDMIGASTFTSFIQKDEPTIKALNAAGLDVSSVGNHEFDQGFADLTERVMPMADWEYLGANIRDKATGDAALPEYFTQTFDGVTIGFVGAVTDELESLVSPAGIADITVEDPTEAINRVADQLSDGNDENGEADIVVALVHEGAATVEKSSAVDGASRFGKIVLGVDANVDAVVSGHTHLAYNHVITTADSPAFKHAPMPVISSGQYGERFSKMDIQWDRKTKTFTMKNEIFSLMDGTTPLFADDPAVKPIVDDAVKVADELGSVPLGTADGAFGRAVASDPAGASSFPENRGGESTLGNLVADAQLWSLNEDRQDKVDVAFMNPGGLRADLASGTVTYRQAANVQPFANTLVTLNLTGAQIKQVLEEQWQPTGSSRPFLKLGVNKEFTYTYDPTVPPGSPHITEMRLNGELIDLSATYLVGANSFLAAGGDNFFTLGKGTNKADSGKIDLESMVDYLAAAPNQTVKPDTAQRAVGVDVQGDGTYAPGETVTVLLSSLDFSRSETAAGTVVISQGGAQLATAPVVRAYTPTVDEIGKATVTFAVPAGASGQTRFDITVPTTGTVSSFTLNVG
ncbi:ExeM/NucH family extracellular endonuclease [Agromyces sp. H3Y2-19a]|uniref:ExeM/NucH family extracellular endonuclease n=1 Tax=Agromyces chromiiresistens TaxID=3030835 RepID=UPI0023B8B36A|nr:ExeM/NucH family extracellular endonuclease [Agromyces chromiiresistens]MDF0512461.1 ExeM/NucH family extracellular endonuclease [Agromyces chromiiresistens]